jgi:hypothetical protein
VCGQAAYEVLRQVAFDERCKIRDLLIEGVELASKKRGYPALDEMAAEGTVRSAVAGLPMSAR